MMMIKDDDIFVPACDFDPSSFDQSSFCGRKISAQRKDLFVSNSSLDL
jgi:hypothetical protein